MLLHPAHPRSVHENHSMIDVGVRSIILKVDGFEMVCLTKLSKETHWPSKFLIVCDFLAGKDLIPVLRVHNWQISLNKTLGLFPEETGSGYEGTGNVMKRLKKEHRNQKHWEKTKDRNRGSNKFRNWRKQQKRGA